jgi:hypothetical protein
VPRSRHDTEVIARGRRNRWLIVAFVAAFAFLGVVGIAVVANQPAHWVSPVVQTPVPVPAPVPVPVPVPLPVPTPVPVVPSPAPVAHARRPPTAQPVSAVVPAPEPPLATPSPTELAALYAAVGRELKVLDRRAGEDATADLWPRYRWIRLTDGLGDASRRADIAGMLTQLRRDIATRTRAQGSAGG